MRTVLTSSFSLLQWLIRISLTFSCILMSKTYIFFLLYLYNIFIKKVIIILEFTESVLKTFCVVSTFLFFTFQTQLIVFRRQFIVASIYILFITDIFTFRIRSLSLFYNQLLPKYRNCDLFVSLLGKQVPFLTLKRILIHIYKM